MSLKSAKVRDLYPEARVIVETQPARYRFSGSSYVKVANAEYLEFKEMTAITSTCSVEGKASASITMASHRDALHSKARSRLSRTEKRQAELSAYLTEVLKLSSLEELNPRRRPLSPGVRRLFGIPVEKLGRKAQRFIYVLEQENGHIDQGQEPKTRSEEYAAFEWYIADFQTMRRIWIDYRDRNRNWVAGFTGIISQIQDYYTVGDTPMLSIVCSGMMRFYELTEYITSQAVQMLEWPFETGLDQFPVQALSNSLGGMDALQISQLMAEQVNVQFALLGASAVRERRPDDFYYHDLLLRTDDTDDFGDGAEDISPERDFTEALRVRPAPSAFAPRFAPGPPSTPEVELRPRLILDPQIKRSGAGRLDVYRAAIRQAFELYNFENSSPFQIMRDVTQVTNYEFFEDPKGNLNLWAPKYDALPRIEGELGTNEQFSRTTDANGIANGFVTRFGIDYSDLPFHDERYILDDVSLLSWNLSESEEAIRTFCRVTNQPHYIQQDNDLARQVNIGYTSFKGLKQHINIELAQEVQRLNRRYGVRRFTMPSVQTQSAFGAVDMLTRFAYASLVRLNAYAFAGTVTLEQRPDLWPGRSIYLVERQKLGYITRVSNDFRSRQAFKTTITVAYLHHPSQRIGIPWWEASAKQSPIPQTIAGIMQ